MDPPSRNLVAANQNNEQCPHCVNAGGTDNVKARAKGVHPSRKVEGSHGICGDPVQNHPWNPNPAEQEYMVPGKVYRTYTEGQIITIAIGISTHHTGHFDFRICDEEGGVNGKTGVGSQGQLAAQRCFDKHVLKRVDPKERPECNGKDWKGGDNDCQPIDPSAPERWYQGPRGHGEIKNAHPYLSKFQQETGLNGWLHAGEGHLMHYRLPEGLTCNKCTLQWHWQTANSCLPDQSYKTYPFPGSGWCGWCGAGWATIAVAGCGNGGRYGEEFWNCADISIKPGSGGGGGRPAPRPAPMPLPVALRRRRSSPFIDLRRRRSAPVIDFIRRRRTAPAPLPPVTRRRRSSPAPLPTVLRRRRTPTPAALRRRRTVSRSLRRRRRRRRRSVLKNWRRRRSRTFGRRRRTSRSLLAYSSGGNATRFKKSETVASVGENGTKSEIAAWAQTPLEWTFSVTVAGLDFHNSSVGDVPEVIHTALRSWLGGDPKHLQTDGEPSKTQSAWLFPFKITLSQPQDELQDVRLDAISLLCLEHDIAICRDGLANFQPVLKKICSGKSCGGLPTKALKINLNVRKHLRFEVVFSPLPQRLIDDVGRFLQSTMENWALRIGPKLRTPVSETADVAEDFIEITNARIEKAESETTTSESGASPDLALVLDMSVGLLAPTSATPVEQRILQELPKDRDWVIDIMGLAAEEEEQLGAIGLKVKALK